MASSGTKKYLHLTIASVRYVFVNSKNLPFIGALVVSYKFLEFGVLCTVIGYLEDQLTEEHQWIAAILINLQDGLSSLFFVIVSLISEEYMGYFPMITICTAAYIQGLMLLWTSASPSLSEFHAVYAAIVFLTLGKSGQKLLEDFLEFQLQEKIKTRKHTELEYGSTQNNELQDLMDTVLTKTWLFGPVIVAYGLTVYIVFILVNTTYQHSFRFAALLMGGTYMLFLFGSAVYSHEEMCVENHIRKIYRICKVAFGKRDLKYQTSGNSHYWDGYKQDHLYPHGDEQRLLPRVPRLFRWLDKAAIVKAEDPEVSPKTQKKNGKLCTVKEVREVKSLVPMMYMCFACIAYSLLLATGNTYFASQASNMEPVITTKGNDVSILFLIKDGAANISRFMCFLISFAFRHVGKSCFVDYVCNKKAAIIRIGFGMVCAVLCSLVAWQVEVRRLKVNKEMDFKHPDRNSTVALVPQFSLLGMTEGLVDGGFSSLFHWHVSKSMWRFEGSFSELAIGSGKLFTIPFLLIIRRWFKNTIKSSQLDMFYLTLGILNGVSFFFFGYYSFTYAYKEMCPEDVKLNGENSKIQEMKKAKVDLISESGIEIQCSGQDNRLYFIVLFTFILYYLVIDYFIVWKICGMGNREYKLSKILYMHFKLGCIS